MAIVGEDLDNYVWNQIVARQEFLGEANKTDQNLVFFNAKTSWVKLASGVFLEDSKARELASTTGDIQFIKGKGLAKNHVLSSGLSSFDGSTKSLQQRGGLNTSNTFNNSYDINSEFGIVPMPGLKNVSIKALNRGSLKKAKIKLRVENYKQLQIIDTLYLRLGYTLLLEWGNSIYLDKNKNLKKPTPTFLEETFFNLGKNQSYLNLLPQIEDLRKSSSGNYDGFIGKVSNFNWNFNEDGSYDINLELISLGDVIESLKSNVVLDKSTTSFIKTLTGGGSSTILSDLNNTVNAYRDSNSLFSLLYLYKYQNQSTVGGNTYDMSKGLCISSVQNGASFENYFVGDVCTPGAAATLSTNEYEIIFNLTLGYGNGTSPQYTDLQPFLSSPVGVARKRTTLGYIEYPSPIQIQIKISGADSTIADPTTGLDLFIKGLRSQPTQPSDITYTVIGGPNYSSIAKSEASGGLSFVDLKENVLPFFSSDPNTSTPAGTDQRQQLLDGKNPFDSNLSIALAKYDFVPIMLARENGQLVNTPSGFAYYEKVGFGPGKYTYKKVSQHYNIQDSEVGQIQNSPQDPSIQKLQLTNLYASNFKEPGNAYANINDKVNNNDIPNPKANFTYTPTVSLAGSTVPNPLIDAQKKIYGGISTKVDVVRLYTNNDGASSMKYYIRFKHLLDLLKTDVLSRVDTNSTTYENNPSIIDINTQDDPNQKTGKNRFVSFMQYKPNINSFNPSDCIVRNTIYPDLSNSKTYYNHFDKDNGSKLNSKSLEKFSFGSPKNPEGYQCNSMNIYLSFDFVGDLLQSNLDDKGNLSIYSFIKGICNGINRAFGGINNLEPVIDETTNILSIVDSSKNNAKDFNQYKINPFGLANSKTQGSFVRDVGLKTAITPSYATMVTVGATAGGYVKGVEATAFANWNRGIVDRFNTGLVPANKNSTSGAGQLQDTIDLFETIFTGDLSHFGVSGFGNKTKISSGVNDYLVDLIFDDGLASKNLNIATEYFKAYPVLNNQTNYDGGNIGFIPFNVSLKMDGISGIKIYNKIELDTRFLPPNYTKSLNFIVTGVDHRLSNNDWETHLNLTLIPNPTTKYAKTRASGIKFNSSSPTSPTIITGGGGLDPIKKLKSRLETGGTGAANYDIYNFYRPRVQGRKDLGASNFFPNPPGDDTVSNFSFQGVNFGKGWNGSLTRLTSMTVKQVLTFQKKTTTNLLGTFYGYVYGSSGTQTGPFAVGAYQIVPDTLYGLVVDKNVVALSDIFDANTQEKLGEYLLLTRRRKLGAYLQGTNGGSMTDLENACQEIAQEFASFPTINLVRYKNANGTNQTFTISNTAYAGQEGNVQTGAGELGFYQDGVNSSKKSATIADVVQALITSRIQHSNIQPSFIPTYYVPPSP